MHASCRKWSKTISSRNSIFAFTLLKSRILVAWTPTCRCFNVQAIHTAQQYMLLKGLTGYDSRTPIISVRWQTDLGGQVHDRQRGGAGREAAGHGRRSRGNCPTEEGPILHQVDGQRGTTVHHHRCAMAHVGGEGAYEAVGAEGPGVRVGHPQRHRQLRPGQQQPGTVLLEGFADRLQPALDDGDAHHPQRPVCTQEAPQAVHVLGVEARASRPLTPHHAVQGGVAPVQGEDRSCAVVGQGLLVGDLLVGEVVGHGDLPAARFGLVDPGVGLGLGLADLRVGEAALLGRGAERGGYAGAGTGGVEQDENQERCSAEQGGHHVSSVHDFQSFVYDGSCEAAAE